MIHSPTVPAQPRPVGTNYHATLHCTGCGWSSTAIGTTPALASGIVALSHSAHVDEVEWDVHLTAAEPAVEELLSRSDEPAVAALLALLRGGLALDIHPGRSLLDRLTR